MRTGDFVVLEARGRWSKANESAADFSGSAPGE